MSFNMKMRSIGLTSALLLSAATAFAAEQDTVVQQQKSLLEKLDSLNAAVLGLKLNGSAKAGGATSMASSDQFSDLSPTQENQAYTDVNLVVTARPSSETEVRVELRLHKDWQSGFEENNNPVLGHWFSYDGLLFNKTLAFNLGYMRVGYTPLTMHTPQAELLQEPEVFAESRSEALAQRNLDTTSRRLLQGLNVDYHSGKVAFFDDIHAQATGARLRNIAKKNDQVFFDFDWSDRYLYGGRLGLDAFGAHVGANFVNVFDRKLSTDSHDQGSADTLILDDNAVFSAEIGYDSKSALSNLPISFGVFGEMAMSWWKADMWTSERVGEPFYGTSTGLYPNVDGILDTVAYIKSQMKYSNKVVKQKFGDDDGMSFYVEPFVKGEFGDFSFDLKGRYLQNDENFWSEMASSPSYRGNSVVLNSNGLYADSVYTNLVASFGASSLENLYFSVYNSNPLNQQNIMSPASATALSGDLESAYSTSRLYNNFKNAHFYRNGYNADVMKRLEASEAFMLMDPSMNMALPYGIATPDRKGFAVSLDLDYAEAIEVNGRFSQYNQDAIDNKYTQFAAGLGVNVGRLFGLDRDLIIQGSYDHAEEDAFYERTSDRIMAGASLDIWGPISLLAGYQSVVKEYGNPLWIATESAITKAEEALLLVGPRIKIAPASYISVQYGMLTNAVSFSRMGVAEDGVTPIAVNDELSIDKNVIIADVTVAF